MTCMNFLVLSPALGVGAAATAQQHEHGASTGAKLGTVAFATSCSAAVAPQFNRAVALLHSFEFGHDAVGRARTIGPKTDPERAYVDAVAQLYDSFGSVDQRTRLTAYRDRMAKLAAVYPTDSEPSIFYALSVSAVAAATPLDKSYAEPQKAGAILEHLLATQPDHREGSHLLRPACEDLRTSRHTPARPELKEARKFAGAPATK
jgi:hypothetical protein